MVLLIVDVSPRGLDPELFEERIRATEPNLALAEVLLELGGEGVALLRDVVLGEGEGERARILGSALIVERGESLGGNPRALGRRLRDRGDGRRRSGT